MSLVDCRVALETYRKGWWALGHAEKWVKDVRVSTIREINVVSGTYGILWMDSVKFVTLGSVLRGIPGREWDISLKHPRASIFTFYPQADVLAVVEEVAWT